MMKTSSKIQAMVASAVAIATTNLPRAFNSPNSPRHFFRNQEERIAGCKGDKSLTAAKQHRAAVKRNNIRKNPKGAR